MLDRLATVCILSGIFTFLMILKDIIRSPHPVRIMNLVWPVTGLYMPFLAWVAWWYFGRKSRLSISSRSGAAPHSPQMKEIFTSTSHCAAGCVSGGIVAIPVVSFMNDASSHSLLLIYAIFSFGLSFVFGMLMQFLALRQLECVSILRSLWRAFKTDVFTLVVYQAGMFLYMELAFRFILHDQIDPRVLSLWFMLQIALFTGFIFAWPATKFLLKRGIKPVI